MNIIIYEDNKTEQFKPFTLNHATFELQCGTITNLDRIKHWYDRDGNNTIILSVRSEIEPLVRLRYPDMIVNPENIPEGKYINGRFTLTDKLDLDVFPNKPSDDDLIINNLIAMQYIWDIVFKFKEVLSLDFSKYNYNEDIKVAESAHIKEGVILDSSNGPIIINSNVTVDIGALLQGPLFIDSDSYIAPGAKIRPGTMIGKNCKVGGEVSNSIFYANSNKVHDGFIGDSFIGEWVNIGAGTNNSNLKNNYSNVRFCFNGNDSIDTDHQFLGSMIGDYTRIGISTMLNTGSYIGLGANVFGPGFQDKHIASFSWGKDRTKTNFDKFIKTCEQMYLRRDKELSEIEINFLHFLYNKK
jgi:acetyltransferase-like isoleucine patch superfamily enzyme